MKDVEDEKSAECVAMEDREQRNTDHSVLCYNNLQDFLNCTESTEPEVRKRLNKRRRLVMHKYSSPKTRTGKNPTTPEPPQLGGRDRQQGTGTSRGYYEGD